MSMLKSLILLWCICFATSHKFPTYINKCHKSNPKLETCFKEALKDIQPYLLKGIPEFHLPNMNPLTLPLISLDSGDSFQAKFHNVEIYKAHIFNIVHSNINLDNNHLEIKVQFPHLRIKSHYEIQGKLLFLMLNGNGPADGNLTDVSIKATFDGHRYQKQGKEHIKFTDMHLEEDIGFPTFKFEDLFVKNPELTEQTNKVVNENIQDIVKELQPVIDTAINTTVLEFVGRVFSRFSVDELFPL